MFNCFRTCQYDASIFGRLQNIWKNVMGYTFRVAGLNNSYHATRNNLIKIYNGDCNRIAISASIVLR